MPDPDLSRPALAAALTGTHPEIAAWLAQPETTLKPYPTPFFHRFRIDQIVYRTRHHALGVHVAWAPGQPAYLLTGEPQNFVAAALADPVDLDSAGHAVAYVLACLDTTRAADELLFVVDSVEALRFYPNPNPSEQQRIAALRQAYAGLITPAAARRIGANWRVTAFVVRQQALERTVARVTRFGSIEMESEILEGGLPVVFGHR
jgi:hypothetical protein